MQHLLRMMSREPIILGWSGGKDSSLTLQKIREEGRYEVISLLTTFDDGVRRISTHGVRCSLLNKQSEALGIPCKKVYIPQDCDNTNYELLMQKALLEFKANGITKLAFGDLFLEEIRNYRDRMLAEINMNAIYPIWGSHTGGLAMNFINKGFFATLVCVDSLKLDSSYAGQKFNNALLDQFPSGIDPCGENGEFHTFVHDGPIFNQPVDCSPGKVLKRGQYFFADLLPQSRGKINNNLKSSSKNTYEPK